jgi:hypothetical protein
MPVRSTAVPVLVLILALASPAAAAPPGGKIKYPSKSGIYARPFESWFRPACRMPTSRPTSSSS